MYVIFMAICILVVQEKFYFRERENAETSKKGRKKGGREEGICYAEVMMWFREDKCQIYF